MTAPATLTRGLPFDTYCALDSVNVSTLKSIEISPRHYMRALAAERRETSALRIGRALHSLLLDPNPEGVAIYEGAVRRGKAWEAFAAAHAGAVILRQEEAERVQAMRAAVLAHPIARDLLSEGEGEVTIEWTLLGHRCRGRLDWLRPNGSIVEVKTTRKVEPRTFSREFAARYYHAQVAFYAGGLQEATGEVAPEPPHVIAIENEEPYDVAVYRAGDDVIEAGARKIDEWLRALEKCVTSGEWPGVGSDIIDLRLPDWALAPTEDVDLSGLGEEPDHG